MSSDKMAALERLQAIDLQIEALAKEAERGPARLTDLEAHVNVARDAADAERRRLADNERAQRQLEYTLADDKEKVKKWESRLPQLKHPREFAALQREVEAAKKTNAEAEESLTRLQAEETELKLTLATHEKELSTRESAYKREQRNLKSRDAELRDQIDNLREEREKHRGAVDARLLQAYENLRRKRPGKAFVPVTNSSCSGCHRRLAPQQANRLLVTGAIEPCPSCLRLLYTPLEVPESDS